MDRDPDTSRTIPVLPAVAIVGALALPFVPLALALLENTVFGTGHVEQFCRDIHIHDALSRLYRLFGI